MGRGYLDPRENTGRLMRVGQLDLRYTTVHFALKILSASGWPQYLILGSIYAQWRGKTILITGKENPFQEKIEETGSATLKTLKLPFSRFRLRLFLSQTRLGAPFWTLF